MKSKTRPISFAVLLFFGLTSCGSDENPVQNFQPSIKEEKPESAKIEPLHLFYQHPDSTSNSFKDTKTLSIESSINFTGTVEAQFIPEEAKIEAVCHFADSTILFKKTSVAKNPAKIQVASLIPYEIFQGKAATFETPPVCEISMELLASSTTRVEVKLLKLKIEGIPQFSNFQPFAHVQISPFQELGINETAPWLLNSHFNLDLFRLACNGSEVSTLESKGSPNLKSLSRALPKDKSRHECRLLGSSISNPDSVYLSPIFFLNGDPAAVTVTHRYLHKVRAIPEAGWYPANPKGPVVIYEVTNQSNAPAALYVSIYPARMSVQLQFLATLALQNEPKVLSGPLKTRPIQWNLKSGSVTLQPGQVLKLIGTVSGVGTRCLHVPTGRTYGTGTTFVNLPKISQNRFSSGTSPVWSTVIDDNVSGILNQNIFLDYSFWEPEVIEANGVYLSPSGSLPPGQFF